MILVQANSKTKECYHTQSLVLTTTWLLKSQIGMATLSLPTFGLSESSSINCSSTTIHSNLAPKNYKLPTIFSSHEYSKICFEANPIENQQNNCSRVSFKSTSPTPRLNISSKNANRNKANNLVSRISLIILKILP